MRNNQSGNVFFLCMIAIMLFAALSYVVTQSAEHVKETEAAETVPVQDNNSWATHVEDIPDPLPQESQAIRAGYETCVATALAESNEVGLDKCERLYERVRP